MKIKFAILFLLINSCVYAQQEISEKDLAKIDSLSLQDVVNRGPGVATGIIKDGKVVYVKYAGYENLKYSTLITSKSRFNIASNAKQFTAFAILNLVHEGKLKLNDDLRKFLPSLYPDLKEKISIANLLNHSSGIRDVYDLWSLQGIVWWKNTFNNQDVISILNKQKDLNFKPGEKYLYSNSNYILLAEVVEKVAGSTFIEYTNQLFKKLGMPNTSFVDDYKAIAPPLALPYFNFDTWTGYNWICNIKGDGNLFSTLSDQLVWEKIIQSQTSPHFSKKLLARTQQLVKNSKIKKYGYGLEFGDYKGFDYKFHEGSTGAWKATTLRFPAQELSIVTLTNSGKAISAMQSRQVADVALGIDKLTQNYLIKPSSEGLFTEEKNIIGTYQTDNDFTFIFEMKGADLYLKRFGRNDIKIVREANNIFHQENDPAFKQEFKLNAQNEMEVTAYYISHAPYSLKRINLNLAKFNLVKINGKYFNEETGAYLQVTHHKDQYYTLNLGNRKIEGILVDENKMLSESYNFSFKGDFNELLLNNDRIKNVKFKRIQ